MSQLRMNTKVGASNFKDDLEQADFLDSQMKRIDDNLEKQVFESLDNAVKNGYDLFNATIEQITEDLKTNDADLEKYSEKKLMPLVRKWRLSKNG